MISKGNDIKEVNKLFRSLLEFERTVKNEKDEYAIKLLKNIKKNKRILAKARLIYRNKGFLWEDSYIECISESALLCSERNTILSARGLWISTERLKRRL